MKNYDVAVIGGGASGMMAAISAKLKNNRLDVIIFEGNDRVGKKLLQTGNGRCNISNKVISKDMYFGDTLFFEKVYKNFDLEDTLHFFDTIGIPTVMQEDNKLYPRSLQAGSVVDQLRFMIEDLKIDVVVNCKVDKISKSKDFFLINEKIKAKKVIICSGGKSAPKTGSDGSGYNLLKNFGHRCTGFYPAIVQITTKKDKIKPLKGIKFNGTATIITANGKTVKETGEILFTDYGISGPPVLQLSRYCSVDKIKNISLDILPEFSRNDLEKEIKKRIALFKNRAIENLLVGLINKRLGQTIIKNVGVEQLGGLVDTLSETQIKKIINEIKNFKLEVTGTKSFEQAQVTAGGIETEDFDFNTLESKIVPGLYAAGEVLNIDGKCGGYNLQWAWTSGFIAGKSAARCF